MVTLDWPLALIGLALTALLAQVVLLHIFLYTLISGQVIEEKESRIVLPPEERERWSDDVAIVHISVLVGNAMQRFDVLAPNLVGCQFAHSVLSKIGFLLPFNTLACQSKEDWFHLEIVFLFAKAGSS